MTEKKRFIRGCCSLVVQVRGVFPLLSGLLINKQGQAENGLKVPG